LGNEIGSCSVDIGKIATSATRNQNLFAGFFGVFKNDDSPTSFSRLSGAKQPCGSTANDNNIKHSSILTELKSLVDCFGRSPETL
jgi:hypothetical protein